MITLITGGTGTGKTALAVSMLADLGGSRPIFSFGIRDLKLDHQPTPPLDQWTVMEPTPEDPNLLQPVFTFPPNSIIVIDEAQNIYRPRAATTKVPPHVAAFEAHRHKGIDFWIITQDPTLIDVNVRRLVRRHLHVRETFMGRTIHEWPEVGDPESKASRQISASKRYKLPSRIFSLYKSAEFHAAPLKKTRPVAFYIAIACVLGAVLFGWRMYSRFNGPKPDAKAAPAELKSDPVKPAHGPQRSADPVVTPEEYIQQRNPRLPGLVHTAQVYDAVTRPTRAPVPAGCVSTAKRCKCFTQDATPIHMDESLCRQIVAGGFFLDFEPEGEQGRAASARNLDLGETASPASRHAQVVLAPSPSPVSTIPDRGDFVGVSSRTRDQVSPMSTDRTYQDSVPGDQQAFAPRSPGRF